MEIVAVSADLTPPLGPFHGPYRLATRQVTRNAEYDIMCMVVRTWYAGNVRPLESGVPGISLIDKGPTLLSNMADTLHFRGEYWTRCRPLISGFVIGVWTNNSARWLKKSCLRGLTPLLRSSPFPSI